MKVIGPGHSYVLHNFDKDSGMMVTGEHPLTFRKDPAHNDGAGHNGTNNQEVLRALIDRVKFLDKQRPHAVNHEIIGHLRAALVLHEIRALERKTEKCSIAPELIAVDHDGHFKLQEQ